MSLSIGYANGEESLATNSGWSAVGSWIEGLPADQYPELHSLWARGLGTGAAVDKELGRALMRSPPADRTVQMTLHNLQRIAREHPGAIAVSDGIGEDRGGEDEWDPEAIDYEPDNDEPIIPQIFSEPVLGDGVMGDTLLGSDTDTAREHGPAPGLIERRVTVHRADGSTFERTQMVRPGESPAAGSQTPAVAGGHHEAAGGHHEAEEPPGHDHVLDGLAEAVAKADPAAAARPGLMHRLGDAALTAAAKAHLFLLRHHQAIDRIGAILGAVLDTPSDLEKLGYNPTAAGVSGHGHTVADPMQQHLGISTHLACTVASHALARALIWAKRAVAGRTTEADLDVRRLAAEFIREALAAVNEELGLDGLPSVERILEGLG